MLRLAALAAAGCALAAAVSGPALKFRPPEHIASSKLCEIRWEDEALLHSCDIQLRDGTVLDAALGAMQQQLNESAQAILELRDVHMSLHAEVRDLASNHTSTMQELEQDYKAADAQLSSNVQAISLQPGPKGQPGDKGERGPKGFQGNEGPKGCLLYTSPSPRD